MMATSTFAPLPSTVPSLHGSSFVHATADTPGTANMATQFLGKPSAVRRAQSLPSTMMRVHTKPTTRKLRANRSSTKSRTVHRPALRRNSSNNTQYRKKDILRVPPLNRQRFVFEARYPNSTLTKSTTTTAAAAAAAATTTTLTTAGLESRAGANSGWVANRYKIPPQRRNRVGHLRARPSKRVGKKVGPPSEGQWSQSNTLTGKADSTRTTTTTTTKRGASIAKPRHHRQRSCPVFTIPEGSCGNPVGNDEPLGLQFLAEDEMME